MERRRPRLSVLWLAAWIAVAWAALPVVLGLLVHVDRRSLIIAGIAGAVAIVLFAGVTMAGSRSPSG